MTADLSASGYLVDGTALAAAGVRLHHDGAGLWTGASEELGVNTFPGRDGGIIAGGVIQPFTYSTMYEIKGAGYDATWGAIQALRRRCKPRRTVTLTREMPDPDGTDANTSHTTTARRLTDRPAWLTPTLAQLDIDWEIVGGPWLGPTDTVTVPGTVTVKGDLPTRLMTITLDAGAARTITHTTNGFWFTYSATIPAGGVLIDVVKRTARSIASGADVSASLSWGKVAPMQLEAGANALYVSSGTASIDYQPAYL